MKRRLRILAWSFGCLVFALVLAIVIDAMRQRREPKEQLGKASVTIIKPSLREFGSDYFTFNAHESWKAMTEESSPTKYVYRSYRGALVEQELIIYVNDTAPNLVATRVLPVTIDKGSQLILGEVSGHCGKDAKSKNIISVTIEQTTITCQTDGTNFIVVVAERGGNTKLSLKHNNETASYSFLFRSSTFPADATQLLDILNSFSSL